MNKTIASIEKALSDLQELGFELNDFKRTSELKLIHISSYEQLLDWTIDMVTALKDTIK